MRKIRVLVVEDSLVFRDLLVKNLNADSGIEVVATSNRPSLQYIPTLLCEIPHFFANSAVVKYSISFPPKINNTFLIIFVY